MNKKRVGKSPLLWICQIVSILFLIGFFGCLVLSFVDFDALKSGTERKREGVSVCEDVMTDISVYGEVT